MVGAPGAGEQAVPSEQFSIGESYVRLGKRSDAVCGGGKAQLSIIESAPQDKQREQAEELAATLGELKTTPGGKEPLYKTAPSADRILKFNDVLATLNKRFPGLMVNVHSPSMVVPGASSLAMIAFVDYLAVHQNDTTPSGDILKGAYAEAELVYQQISVPADEKPAIAAAFIDAEGNMTCIQSDTMQVVVINKSKGVTTARSTDKSYEQKVEKGDKIVLCDNNDVDVLKTVKTKSVKDIIDTLADPSKDKTSAAAGETVQSAEGAAPIPHVEPVHHEVIIPKKVTYENDTTKPPVKVVEYIKTPEYQQNKVWLESVIQKINASGSTDPAIKALKKGANEDEIVYTKRVVQALKKHLAEAGEHENTPLSLLAAEAEDTSSGQNPDRGGELTALDAVENILNKAPGLYDARPGTVPAPEVGGNPEEVKTAFTEAFALYSAEMQALETRDSGTLTQPEKEMLAQYRYTKAAYEQAKKSVNWRFDVELRGPEHGQPPSHFIEEGIPVEGVIDFLQKKIDSATDKSVPEAKKLIALHKTLLDKSELYKNIPLKDRNEQPGEGRKFKKIEGELIVARYQLEAFARSEDPLRASHNSNDQQRMAEDWEQGKKDIAVRRELIIPKKTEITEDLGTVYEKKGNQDANAVLTDLADVDSPEPAPVPKKKGKGTENPDPPEPAPGKEGGEPAEDDDNINPKPAPTDDDDDTRPQLAPEMVMEANFVLAKVPDRYTQNGAAITEHAFSSLEQGRIFNGPLSRPLTKIPLIGGIFKAVFDPVQFIWRNNLARDSAKAQDMRTVTRMNVALKSHFMAHPVEGQMRIPVELTSELFDKTILKGKELLKKQGLLTRLRWGVTDILSKVTTIGETAEMHFAREWLEDELVKKQPIERDPSIRAIYDRALSEQDAVASRIALGDSDNLHNLRRGERREVVQNSPLEDSIKRAIADYFAETGSITGTDTEENNKRKIEAQTRLVAKINVLGKTQDSGGPINLKDSLELASNILSVVKDLDSTPAGAATGQTKWKILKERDKWKDFKINVITAQSRWGAEGGAEMPNTLINKLTNREGVFKKMAERELLRGEGYWTDGVGLTSSSIAFDIATYGGAFAAGALSSITLTGVRSAIHIMGGGLTGVMGMTAFKEVGWRMGGAEIFQGRFREEVSRTSQDIALGKKTPDDARIRKGMEKALVALNPEFDRADKISGRIQALLSIPPEQLVQRDAYKLLNEIAQLDARMRIADISGTKDLQFTVQNYIIYDELKRNEQYFDLKSKVMEGLQKVIQYKTLHPEFGGDLSRVDPNDPNSAIRTAAEQIRSGFRIEYGKKQEKQLGLFEKFSALAEAQLRVGSRVEVLKWLQDTNKFVIDNNAGLGMTKDEATTLVNTYSREVQEGAKGQDQSIRAKKKQLNILVAERAVKMVAMSTVMMPVSGVIMGAEAHLVSGIAQEVGHAAQEGIPAWASDWGAVIAGHAPVHALSPVQDGFLAMRHTLLEHSPTLQPAPHDEVINGIHVQLPSQYKYVPGSHGDDKIVDLNGNVVKDLSNISLGIVNGRLVETNAIGHITNNDAIADFHASGISLHQSSTIDVQHTETVITPGNTISQTFEGHTMQVPEGTHWVHDPVSGQSDLVSDTHPNVILINDAQIGTNGEIVSGQLLSGVRVDVTPGGSQEIHVIGENGMFTQSHDNFDIHTQRQPMYGGNENNGLAYHRPIYDYKETNPQTGDAVYVIQAGRGEILFPAHDPSVTFNVPQEMQAGNLYFTISIPGHGDLALHANYSAAHDGINDALRLDPSDTTLINSLQGNDFHGLTYGDVAKMFVDQANLREHPDGILGTEYNSLTHEILHLTPAGAPNPGVFTSSIFHNDRLYDFGGVRGEAPLNDVIVGGGPSVTTVAIDGPLTELVTQHVPQFVVDPPAGIDHYIPVIIPILPAGRENAEAVTSTASSQVSVASTVTPPPRPANPPPGPASAELTDEEKLNIRKIAEGEVIAEPYASSKDILETHLGLIPPNQGAKEGGSFGKYEKENEVTATNERYIKAQKAAAHYEAAKRELENEKKKEEQQQNKKRLKERQDAYDDAKKELIKRISGRDGGHTAFGKAEITALDAYLEEQKPKKLQAKIESKEKLEKDRKAKALAESGGAPPEASHPKLTQRFAGIEGESKLDHRFVVKNVPNKPVSENLSSYELKEPFFDMEDVNNVVPNKNAASYVYELGDVNMDKSVRPEAERNERFLKAEKSTNFDSGMLAVAAASADTPEKQAKLYRYLAGSVLAVHNHNPELFDAWLKAQGENGEANSATIFVTNDLIEKYLPNLPDGTPVAPIRRTDKNMQLLVTDDVEGEGIAINYERTANLWKTTRIPELVAALKNDDLKEYHYRWLEFLSHSVKVPELILAAQGTH